MTANIKRLSQSLLQDTPEETLRREIDTRGLELREALRQGRPFQLRDSIGRIVTISPSLRK